MGEILLSCRVNAVSDIRLMIVKPGLKSGQWLLEMLLKRRVENMSVSRKNKMLMLVKVGDCRDSLPVNFIGVSF